MANRVRNVQLHHWVSTATRTRLAEVVRRSGKSQTDLLEQLIEQAYQQMQGA